MLKRVKVDLEETLLQELDGIVKKMGELSQKGYSAWSISREDLIRFAVASTFGLAYPYINVRKKNVSRVAKELRKFKYL